MFSVRARVLVGAAVSAVLMASVTSKPPKQAVILDPSSIVGLNCNTRGHGHVAIDASTNNSLRRCRMTSGEDMDKGSWARVPVADLSSNPQTANKTAHFTVPWASCGNLSGCYDEYSWLPVEHQNYLLRALEYAKQTAIPSGFPVYEPATCSLDRLTVDWDEPFFNRLVVMVGDSVSDGLFRTIAALVKQKYRDEVEVVSNPTCGAEHKHHQNPREFDAKPFSRWAPQYCVVVRRKNLYICQIAARAGGMNINLSGASVYDFLTSGNMRPVGLSKDDVFIMNNAMVYGTGAKNSLLHRELRQMVNLYNSGRGHQHKSSPTVAWRETSPQSFTDGMFLNHTKGACCYEPGYNPKNQWAKDAEGEFSKSKLKIPLLKTYHATAKLAGEDRLSSCLHPPAGPPKKLCPACREKHYRFPSGFNLSDSFARRAFDALDPFSGSPPCNTVDGTHYFTSGPSYYHWFRVVAHFIRDLPQPDPTRNVSATFNAYQRVLRSCSMDNLGWLPGP
eukprot:gene5224-7971_t